MERDELIATRDGLKGILPPITTPFDHTGALRVEGLEPQIDMMVDSGVAGVVVGGSTGEGHTLLDEEFAHAVRVAHDAANGRVPFIVGLIVNSTMAAIERVKLLKGVEVDALQVTPVHYLFKPGLEATVRHFQDIWNACQKPILIYNVIPWNYLSVDEMLAIMRRVPGVVGIKQSSGDLKSLSDLMLEVEPKHVVLSGIDALLYSAFSIGAHGAITALTSAVPGVTVKLFDAVAAGDHATGREIHFKLNALWNVLSHDNLPACVKYIQHRQGLDLYYPRPPMERVTDEQRRNIDEKLVPVLESLD